MMARLTRWVSGTPECSGSGGRVIAGLTFTG